MKRCKHCKITITKDNIFNGYMHQPSSSDRAYDQYVFCKITQAEPEEDTKNGGEIIRTPREGRKRTWER